MTRLIASAAAALAFLLASGCASGTTEHDPTGPDRERAASANAVRITLASIPVNDQRRALAFYTEKLGFVLRRDIPLGAYSWLTVTSPAGVDGIELLLEPVAHPAAQTYQAALRADGIPVTTFFVDDLDAEHARLVALGVDFKLPPTAMGSTRGAILDDTVGNWIMLTQELRDD